MKIWQPEEGWNFFWTLNPEYLWKVRKVLDFTRLVSNVCVNICRLVFALIEA